ncbi:MAG: nucleotidyltransferase domain-containing protein [Armatimonadota bacterium]
MPNAVAQMRTETPGLESSLLLACARARLNPDVTDQIRDLVRGTLDWTLLARMAERHRVRPLLFRTLEATIPQAVPAPILAALSAHFDTNTRRSRFLADELLSILSFLEAEGIQAIPFKGPVLAASAYGDLALREFADLDVLVRKQDVPRAKDLLASRGYRWPWSGTRSMPRQERLHLESRHNYKLTRETDGVTVEIEWALAPKSLFIPLDMTSLWDRLMPVSILGTTVASLKPEDLLIILCLHGTKHRWERLLWICDVAALICARPDMDWGRVMELARRLHCLRIVFLGLCLARDLLGSRLPHGMSRRIEADLTAKALAAQVRGEVFRDADASHDAFQRTVFVLRSRERLLDRARVLLFNALTSSERDRGRLHPALLRSLAPFVLRPIRLLRKYGLHPLRHILGS